MEDEKVINKNNKILIALKILKTIKKVNSTNLSLSI
jgi:hypothetical protein